MLSDNEHPIWAYSSGRHSTLKSFRRIPPAGWSRFIVVSTPCEHVGKMLNSTGHICVVNSAIRGWSLVVGDIQVSSTMSITCFSPEFDGHSANRDSGVDLRRSVVFFYGGIPNDGGGLQKCSPQRISRETLQNNADAVVYGEMLQGSVATWELVACRRVYAGVERERERPEAACKFEYPVL